MMSIQIIQPIQGKSDTRFLKYGKGLRSQPRDISTQ